MDLNDIIEPVKLELQIAPLIDVVFLLLIYFMVTASLIKKEGDISFVLPADVTPTKEVKVPVEVLIEIDADGTVFLEGMRFAREDILLDNLIHQIMGFKAIANTQQAPFFVNILPEKNTLHERIVNVMDACAAAKVKNLSFNKSL